MSITTRREKGSALTHNEMDDNLEFLEEEVDHQDISTDADVVFNSVDADIHPKNIKKDIYIVVANDWIIDQYDEHIFDMTSGVIERIYLPSTPSLLDHEIVIKNSTDATIVIDGNSKSIDSVSTYNLTSKSSVVICPDKFNLNYKLMSAYNKSYDELLVERLHSYNTSTSDEYPFETHNFADDTLPYPIAWVLHNYSDSQGIRVDQVGNASHIHLRNTYNETHRPGVTGSGDFLYLDQAWGGSSSGLFKIENDGDLTWLGGTNKTAILTQNKSNDDTWAFQFKTSSDHQYIMNWNNAGKNVLSLREAFSWAQIDSGGSMSNGLILNSTYGNIRLDPYDKIQLYSDSVIIGEVESIPVGYDVYIVGPTKFDSGLTADQDIMISDTNRGLILKSPNGTNYRLKVDNSGNLSTETI
jgi:hypothetical protein